MVCKKISLALTCTALALALGACATAKTSVSQAPEVKAGYQSIQIVEEPSNVQVAPELAKDFRHELESGLFGDVGFARGEQLRLAYRIVQLDEGSRLSRALPAGQSGEGTLTVEVKYFNAKDKQLAATRVESKIEGGVLGGSFDSPVHKAARKVVAYTSENFR
jgi:hypothetical protein